MTRRTSRLAALIGVFVVAATLVACGGREPDIAAATVFAVGDCVQIDAGQAPDPDPARATETSCTADPSYTVGATTDAAGECPTAEYQHLPSGYADPSTARLCLVPNLVAEQCYLMEMPIGLVEKADCRDRGQGVLVQVTQRLDVRDQSACPATAGTYAWPYPQPARTYCTQTLF
ncbi:MULTISPECIES: hypothetical protein [Mycolicibacterium]|uniref:hypothetical protein n=1 Tax=Mycolicibacterium TaxID=1866885 RepID=UPI0004BE35AB|nr:hypothetical protein [Mycolicibacterium neoaurum]QVI28745.1 hypothetical protein MN2019_05225 [Mycolicibacterium neoaurum]TLH48856.1 hypothetical protein C1S81_24750 [Mycolicibacterium neoaurum]